MLLSLLLLLFFVVDIAIAVVAAIVLVVFVVATDVVVVLCAIITFRYVRVGMSKGNFLKYTIRNAAASIGGLAIEGKELTLL